MSATISANLDDATAGRAREIALREHRSMSNLVANAVAVFTDLPKDLRDALLELRAAADPAELKTLTREWSALAAKAKFNLTTRQLVSERKFPAKLGDADDIDLLEAATSLTSPELRRNG